MSDKSIEVSFKRAVASYCLSGLRRLGTPAALSAAACFEAGMPYGRTKLLVRLTSKAQISALRMMFVVMEAKSSTIRAERCHAQNAAWAAKMERTCGLPESAPPPQKGEHSEAVRAEADEIVRETVAHLVGYVTYLGCLRFHGLPKDWTVKARCDWTVGRTRSNGGISRPDGEAACGRVSFSMRRHVPADGEGTCTLNEYPHVADDPEIGTVTADWRTCLRILCAHEVAHAVQRSLCMAKLMGAVEVADDLRDPHGEGWQRIYRELRVDGLGCLRSAERESAAA